MHIILLSHGASPMYFKQALYMLLHAFLSHERQQKPPSSKQKVTPVVVRPNTQPKLRLRNSCVSSTCSTINRFLQHTNDLFGPTFSCFIRSCFSNIIHLNRLSYCRTGQNYMYVCTYVCYTRLTHAQAFETKSSIRADNNRILLMAFELRSCCT